MKGSKEEADLLSKSARLKLRARRKPHWRTVRPRELDLGYVRKRGEAGIWTVRHYDPVKRERGVGSPYVIARLPGVADDYLEADGARVLSFVQAQREALRRADEWARAARDRTGDSLTVRVAIEEYVEYLRREKKTGDDAERRARALIIPQLGDVAIAKLTTERLRRWRDSLADAGARVRTPKGERQRYKKVPGGRTPEERKEAEDNARRARRATANRTMTILKGALNRPFRDGRVADDLAWRRLEPFENVGSARPDYLTVEEGTRLINAAESGFRTLAHAALQTGCRYSELARLRVRDFQRRGQRGVIVIHIAKSSRARDVVLTEEGEHFFEQTTAGRRSDEHLLLREDGVPWRRSMQTRPMREAVERARIGRHFVFHQLRHTWASLAIMNGTPLLVVAQNLGHKDTRMVEKHYGHLAVSYVADAVRAGAPRFGAVRPGNVLAVRKRRR